METEEVARRIIRLTRRSYWLGIGVGLIFGVITGYLIASQFNCNTTLVIPLERGIDV